MNVTFGILVELLPFSIPLLLFSRNFYFIGRGFEGTSSIPFFMGIFGELDHWYHLFVSI